MTVKHSDNEREGNGEDDVDSSAGTSQSCLAPSCRDQQGCKRKGRAGAEGLGQRQVYEVGGDRLGQMDVKHQHEKQDHCFVL